MSESKIRLVAGLGNPGSEYQQTRHNIGFMVVDRLAADLGVSWEKSSKAEAAIAKSGDLILVKPLAFMAGRLFDRAEVETLLRDGKVGPLEGFRSKMGRKFNAPVKLGEDFKQQFDFGENGNGGPLAIDTSKHQEIGICPVCKEGKVYELENTYVCERALATPKTCTFRVSKVILQREIPREQVQKLMTEGKTDLLPKFISKKGRPFSAHLKLENGKIGFQFAEKKPRAKKTAKREAAAA